MVFIVPWLIFIEQAVDLLDFAHENENTGKK